MNSGNRLELALRAVIQKVADTCGARITVTEGTRAMSEIPDFDSLIAEEATMFLEDDLGITIEEQVFHRDGEVLTFAESLELLRKLTNGRLEL